MILFSDFDGTLFFRDNPKQVADNLEAIKAWRNGGNQFCITTGRSYRSVSEQIPEIAKLCDYYIVDSGSIILSSDAKLIEAFYFEPAVVEQIVEFSKHLPEIPVAYYYIPFAEDENHKTEHVTKLRLWFEDVSLLSTVKEQIKELFPVYAFDLALPDNGLPTVPALAGKRGFIEIIPIGFGKSNAIQALGREKNIPSSEIITIGDGLNDYEMIRDFNGYAIEDSQLSEYYKELKTTASISSLIESFTTKGEK